MAAARCPAPPPSTYASARVASVVALHRHQHAPHVGVLDDRARSSPPARRRSRLPCTRVARARERALVGALARSPRPPARPRGARVHHDEHVLEAAVLLADEIADRAVLVAVGEHAVGLAWMPSLCSIDTQCTSLRSPSVPSAFDEELRHDEERDALDALGRVRRAREHEVDDVLGVVVLAVGDEDLLARTACTCRRPAARPRVRTAARSEPACGSVRFIVPVHSPATIFGRYVLLAARRAAQLDRLDRALREHRAQLEREVRRVPHLLDRAWPRAAAGPGRRTAWPW